MLAMQIIEGIRTQLKVWHHGTAEVPTQCVTKHKTHFLLELTALGSKFLDGVTRFGFHELEEFLMLLFLRQELLPKFFDDFFVLLTGLQRGTEQST